MSDPGTTYRTRDEIQKMRSESDAIAGLKKYILEWGVTDEASLKVGIESSRVVRLCLYRPRIGDR